MRLATITNKLAICLLIGFKNNQLNANWMGDVVSGAFGIVGSSITLVGAGLNYGLGVFDPVFNGIDYVVGGFAFPNGVNEDVNALPTDGADDQIDFGAPPEEYFPGMGQPPQGFPGGSQGFPPGMQGPPPGFPGGPQGFPPGMQGPPPGFPGGPQGFPPGMQGPPPQGFPQGQPLRIPPGGQQGLMMRSKKSTNVQESEENSESNDTSKPEIDSEKKPESTEKSEPAVDSAEDLGQE